MDNLWIWLVVGFYPSEKYEFVNWDDDINDIWENKNVPNHQPLSCSPKILMLAIVQGREGFSLPEEIFNTSMSIPNVSCHPSTSTISPWFLGAA